MSSKQTTSYPLTWLEAGWSLNEIGQRYRNLAMEHHPDKGGDQEQMARINRAWSDAQRELGS